MSDPSSQAAPRSTEDTQLMARIAGLERAHRRRGLMNGLLLIGLAGSLALSGAIIFDPALVRGLTEIGSEVRARRYILEDDQGNLRGQWQIDEVGTVRLSIHDATGRARMNLAVLADGAPGISFADEADRRRIVLGLLPDGTATLVFADGSSVPRAILGTSSKGSANLIFADQAGVSRVSVGLDASGAGSLILPEPIDDGEEDAVEGGNRR